MSGILLSYRRQDAGAYARRLHDDLREFFGEKHLFTDAAIALGVDFAEQISQRVASCDVVLVVIGPDWASVTTADGRRRLDEPRDMVRMELETALQRGDVRVIPVLVGGAKMPAPDELPASLIPLTYRHALEIRDSEWDYDTRLLIEAISKRLGGAPEAAAAPVGDRWGWRRGLRRRIGAAGESVRRLRRGRATAKGPPDEVPALAARELMRAREESSVEPVTRLAEPSDEVGGWLGRRRRDDPAELVDCTVFAPPRARPSQTVFVQVFAHALEQAGEAARLAWRFDRAAEPRAVRSLASPIPVGCQLTFELLMPTAEIDEPVQSLIWRGRPESVQFAVALPPAAETPESHIGTLVVRRDMWPVGHVKFHLGIEAAAGRAPQNVPVGDQAMRYSRAFLSYASGDRAKVIDRVQMLRLMNIDYFHDLLSQQPGEHWERRVHEEIDRSDLFILFWSSLARASEWVRKETQYALACKARDEYASPEICPVIVEGPPVAPPWREVAHLHFNDALLYVKAGHSAGAPAPRE